MNYFGIYGHDLTAKNVAAALRVAADQLFPDMFFVTVAARDEVHVRFLSQPMPEVFFAWHRRAHFADSTRGTVLPAFAGPYPIRGLGVVESEFMLWVALSLAKVAALQLDATVYDEGTGPLTPQLQPWAPAPNLLTRFLRWVARSNVAAAHPALLPWYDGQRHLEFTP